MASGDEDRRRYPRNIQGILQMAVDHSDDPASSTSSVFQEMSEEVKNHMILSFDPQGRRFDEYSFCNALLHNIESSTCSCSALFALMQFYRLPTIIQFQCASLPLPPPPGQKLGRNILTISLTAPGFGIVCTDGVHH